MRILNNLKRGLKRVVTCAMYTYRHDFIRLNCYRLELTWLSFVFSCKLNISVYSHLSWTIPIQKFNTNSWFKHEASFQSFSPRAHVYVLLGSHSFSQTTILLIYEYLKKPDSRKKTRLLVHLIGSKLILHFSLSSMMASSSSIFLLL